MMRRVVLILLAWAGTSPALAAGDATRQYAGWKKGVDAEPASITAKRASFKARHARNIAKGPSSAAYWANKVKW